MGNPIRGWFAVLLGVTLLGTTACSGATVKGGLAVSIGPVQFKVDTTGAVTVTVGLEFLNIGNVVKVAGNVSVAWSGDRDVEEGRATIVVIRTPKAGAQHGEKEDHPFKLGTGQALDIKLNGKRAEQGEQDLIHIEQHLVLIEPAPHTNAVIDIAAKDNAAPLDEGTPIPMPPKPPVYQDQVFVLKPSSCGTTKLNLDTPELNPEYGPWDIEYWNCPADGVTGAPFQGDVQRGLPGTYSVKFGDAPASVPMTAASCLEVVRTTDHDQVPVDQIKAGITAWCVSTGNAQVAWVRVTGVRDTPGMQGAPTLVLTVTLWPTP